MKTTKHTCGMLARGRLLAAALSALLFAAVATAADRYQITDLGTLGAPFSAAMTVNSLGQVGGVSANAAANMHGVVLDGALQDVPPLAGDTQSQVFAITDTERIIAVSYDLGEMASRGFFVQGGAVTPVGNLAPRGGNSAGVVVGSAKRFDATLGWLDRAARWVGGALAEIGTLGGNYSYAYDVNDAGWVVGGSSLAGETTRHAFVWIAGQMRDLGTLGGTNSQAYAINGLGEIVGWANTAGGMPHAFLFTTDGAGNVVTRTDLGALNGYSFAYDVNGLSQVVGSSSYRAVLWDGGAPIDLNTRIPGGTGWRLDAAWSINDAGQIAGAGALRGLPRGFLLTPIPHRPGDMNCDGAVDNADIDAFVLALLDAAGYEQAYPNCRIDNGDTNGDGAVDNGDIDGFVACLLGGGC